MLASIAPDARKRADIDSSIDEIRAQMQLAGTYTARRCKPRARPSKPTRVCPQETPLYF